MKILLSTILFVCCVCAFGLAQETWPLQEKYYQEQPGQSGFDTTTWKNETGKLDYSKQETSKQERIDFGNGLISIFDPAEMLVRCLVGEPDQVSLEAGARVKIYLDAYPDLELPGHFESASPIATTALGSSIKTFTALFKIDESDPRLLPDLSAAVVIEARGRKP